MAPNLTLGLPREEKKIFDPKLEERDIPEFEDEGSGYIPDTTPVSVPQIQERNMSWLRVAGIVIAIFAAFVSWVNSFEWFEALRPMYVAVPMAITMIGASVLLPDFGIVLWRAKKRILGAFIMASGVLATLFCMVTTVSALYNSRSWNLSETVVASQAENVANATLADREADRKRLIDTIRRQDGLIDSTQAKIDSLSADRTQGGDSQILQRRLNAYIADRKVYEGQLSALDTELAALRTVPRRMPERKDVYGFMGNIFNADPTLIEFLTVSVPAVFLEIVAPVMVAVAMFL